MSTLALTALLSLAPLGGLAQDPAAKNRIEPPPPATSEAKTVERREQLSRVIAVDRRPVWTGAPISLSLKNADLVEVLRSFARIADVNLVVEPSVQGQVTLELKEVPWDQALWVILKTHGLGAEIDGRIWGVSAGAVAP